MVLRSLSDRPPGKFLVAIDGRRGITRRPATLHTPARGRAEGYFTLTHSRSFVGSEKQEMTRRTRGRVRPALVGVTGLCLIAGVEAKRSPRSVSSRHVSAESVWKDFAGSLATLGIDVDMSCADHCASIGQKKQKKICEGAPWCSVREGDGDDFTCELDTTNLPHMPPGAHCPKTELQRVTYEQGLVPHGELRGCEAVCEVADDGTGGIRDEDTCTHTVGCFWDSNEPAGRECMSAVGSAPCDSAPFKTCEQLCSGHMGQKKLCDNTFGCKSVDAANTDKGFECVVDDSLHIPDDFPCPHDQHDLDSHMTHGPNDSYGPGPGHSYGPNDSYGPSSSPSPSGSYGPSPNSSQGPSGSQGPNSSHGPNSSQGPHSSSGASARLGAIYESLAVDSRNLLPFASVVGLMGVAAVVYNRNKRPTESITQGPGAAPAYGSVV